MKMQPIDSVSKFTILFALLILSTAVLAGKEKTTKESTKTSTRVVLDQERIEVLKTNQGEPALSNSSSSLRTGEQINWHVISSGATNGSSTNFALVGTVGQTAVGSGYSTNFQLSQGFWHDFSSGGCCSLAGDFNGDGNNDISDLSGPTSLVAFMFQGGPDPVCATEGDFNGDGSQDISDLSGPTSMVAFMFQSGPDPVCGPE